MKKFVKLAEMKKVVELERKNQENVKGGIIYPLYGIDPVSLYGIDH